MAKIKITIELNDVDFNDKIINQYDLEDPLSFFGEAEDLASYLQDKYYVKGDTEISFELKGMNYRHLIPMQ